MDAGYHHVTFWLFVFVLKWSLRPPVKYRNGRPALPSPDRKDEVQLVIFLVDDSALSSSKAPSIPSTMSKQHCQSNRQLCRSPVYTSNKVQATLWNATSWTILSTMSNVASTLLPFLATMLPVSETVSNAISSFPQSRNKLNMFNSIGASLQKIWKSHSIPISTKIRLMKALVWSVRLWKLDTQKASRNTSWRLWDERAKRDSVGFMDSK